MIPTHTLHIKVEAAVLLFIHLLVNLSSILNLEVVLDFITTVLLFVLAVWKFSKESPLSKKNRKEKNE